MSEQLVASLFEESTAMYSQGNYSICLALLNDCIYLQPSLSTLYSNRAISNFSLKQIESAFEDLAKSIEINHLNYVAYFNLFSLNFIQSKSEEAFKNLCFSISSIYTALARHERKIDWINKAIYYSYNNKQSILLKAIDHLQNKKLQESLQLLKDAFALQRIEENKTGTYQIINFVEKSLGREISSFFVAQKVDSSPFKLMTDVSCPSEAEFDHKIQEMLKEFNSLNKLIHQYEQESIRQMNPPTEKSIQTSDKMEKQTNCKTIYESNVKEEKESQDECLFSRQGRVDKLNLYSTISEGTNEQDEEINTKISSYDIYPLNENKTVCIYIEQASIYNTEIEQNNDNLYGVFHYMSDESEITIRTAHQNVKEGLCRWSQWSETIQLAQNPSKMSFTMFSKSFTSFDDKIIGKGEFILDSLGYTNIQFKNSANQQVGKLKIIVERAI